MGVKKKALSSWLLILCASACGGSDSSTTEPVATPIFGGTYSLQSVNGSSLPVPATGGRQVTGGTIARLGGDTVKTTHVVVGGGLITIQVGTYHGTQLGAELVLTPIIADFVDTATIGASNLTVRHHISPSSVETRYYTKN